MISAKVSILCCLLAAGAVHPAKLPSSGYGYTAPTKPFTYTPPAPKVKPPQSLYEAPAHKAPETIYTAPAVVQELPTGVYDDPVPVYNPRIVEDTPVYDPSVVYAPPVRAYDTPVPAYTAPEQTYEKGMPFDFGYAVHDDYNGINFGHDSDSDGNVVEGEYRVDLPDGRTQIVTYQADHHNGYQADVKYEGEAKYPEYKPVPSYQAPVQTYEAPVSAYEVPVQTYEAPVSTYEVPVQTYEAPVSAYEVPVQTYEAPTQTYDLPSIVPAPGVPEVTYGTPVDTYEPPQSLYTAPGH